MPATGRRDASDSGITNQNLLAATIGCRRLRRDGTAFLARAVFLSEGINEVIATPSEWPMECGWQQFAVVALPL